MEVKNISYKDNGDALEKLKLLTIITISLNSKEVLEKTILSVIQQPYPKIEYIIIDGGSGDGTVAIIKKYEKFISYWSSEKDNGISDALNKGISLAKGEIIGIIHAGDWYEPGALSELMTFYSEHPADILYGDVNFYNLNGRLALIHTNHIYLLLKMSLAHPGVFVRRQSYETMGGFDGKYKLAMDYDLLMRMFRGGATFRKIPGVVANFVEDGISSKKWKRARRESLDIKNASAESRIEKIMNYIYYYWNIIGDTIKRSLGKQ